MNDMGMAGVQYETVAELLDALDQANSPAKLATVRRNAVRSAELLLAGPAPAEQVDAEHTT